MSISTKLDSLETALDHFVMDVFMTEGRRCEILLPDSRTLELLVQPRLLAKELLDMVASHFCLKEKEFFGLTYIDESEQSNWLQLDRRVLEHDFPKKMGLIALHFTVKFYIESVTYLKDNVTVELFFLNAKEQVAKGLLQVDDKTAFELAAYLLQETDGEHVSDDTARSTLRQLHALPQRIFEEHPSIEACENSVIEQYQRLRELSRGQAIVNYMSVVEKLPTYGVHYYGVKDKQGIPWRLGISTEGISQNDHLNHLQPSKVFQWKQLENLYFREKKFSVEVHDPRRAASSRRTFGQAGIVSHAWYGSPALIKAIWAMAISQHQFYLDRKQSKAKIPTARSLSEIAVDLSESATLPRTMSSRGKLINNSNGSLPSAGSVEMEARQATDLKRLQARQRSLEDELNARIADLRLLCIQEANVTGHLPKEYPLKPGEQKPRVQRRMVPIQQQRMVSAPLQAVQEARQQMSQPCVGPDAFHHRDHSIRNHQAIENVHNPLQRRATMSIRKTPSTFAAEDYANQSFLSNGKGHSEDGSFVDGIVLQNSGYQGEDVLPSPPPSPRMYVEPIPVYSPYMSTTGQFHFHSHPMPQCMPTLCPSLHNRPVTLEGTQIHRTPSQMRNDMENYDSSPIKPRAWTESSLDKPYEKPKKNKGVNQSGTTSESSSYPSGLQSGSLQDSPVRTPTSQGSLESTLDMRECGTMIHTYAPSSASGSPAHSITSHGMYRPRSGSLESGPRLPPPSSRDGTTYFNVYYPGTAAYSSGSSEPAADRLSCASRTSSETGDQADGRLPTSSFSTQPTTLERRCSGGSLGSANSGSLPNLAPPPPAPPPPGGGPIPQTPPFRGGSTAGYWSTARPNGPPCRMCEYPLYADGSPWPGRVVRTFESEHEGHYSVKAQLRLSHSCAGSNRSPMLPPRGSPSPHHQPRQQQRDEAFGQLRSWYEKNTRDTRRLSHAAHRSYSPSPMQMLPANPSVILGQPPAPASVLLVHSNPSPSHCRTPSIPSMNSKRYFEPPMVQNCEPIQYTSQREHHHPSYSGLTYTPQNHALLANTRCYSDSMVRHMNGASGNLTPQPAPIFNESAPQWRSEEEGKTETLV
uniref:FERM domain-containing protein 4A-like isoform X2 n=1 Tax=Myxine glutinosa TaxID=7769 RepID=UPI00358E16A6